MFATARDSIRHTTGRPDALVESLSMICPHDFDLPCTDAAATHGQPPAMSNTIRMYNKLTCGKSFCPGNADTNLKKNDLIFKIGLVSLL